MMVLSTLKARLLKGALSDLIQQIACPWSRASVKTGARLFGSVATVLTLTKNKGQEMARILIGCEFTGMIRQKFVDAGHDAWSCDLLPTEDRSRRHIRRDIRDVINDGWDALIACPPCTRLCHSSVQWLTRAPKFKSVEQVWQELDEAAEFFSLLWNADIPLIALENPIMHRHAKEKIVGYVEPTQIIQPYQFGHNELKRTGLWLKGFPPLVPTTPDVVVPEGRAERKEWQRIHNVTANRYRAKERSRFYAGFAEAMVTEWHHLLTEDDADVYVPRNASA